MSHENDVAVIGMAGRFPGAPDLETFWRNLRDGVESITFFSAEELAAHGVERSALAAPNFVRAVPVLAEADRFDAAFFGYSPREAALLDPQQRVFLECAWAALENAGYCPDALPGPAGVYAGMSMSSYLLFNLLPSPQIDPGEDSFQLMIGTDKDFLTTRVSYHLNLQGPSLDVQTGCSTSLVAVYLACEALLGYHCDLALAGGVSIQVPRRWGYYHEPGGINSPDGHCRAFDADARGTLFGSGAGIVVLKRLADALAGGDSIAAVVRGAAVNNDGAVKVGFTAPGVAGQAEVIARAQAIAGVDPESISYVETHGTGTPFGDPVEVEALVKAFAAGSPRPGSCGLGSVKTNIGHLDAAAGVAGLLKTVLALQHREIPPSLHFARPNPRIDFGGSPFYVVDRLTPWTRGRPLRAGVSSFGIGGTNAHVVLEEAPPVAGAADRGRPLALLVLSARSEAELAAATSNLTAELRRRPELGLADVAYTLQVGRKRFAYRRTAVAGSLEEAVESLDRGDRERVWDAHCELDERPLAFLFPGGGTQYPGMARQLYVEEPVFHAELERCIAWVARHTGVDALAWLYPPAEQAAAAAQRMKQPSLALPVLFGVEYALAQLLLSWGLRPEAMAGHSLGEYVAACLAGVFSLEDALALVRRRGELFEQLPPGAMLSLPLPEAEVAARLARSGEELSLAAVNGPSQCVVSGAVPAIDQLAGLLTAEDIEFRRIQIDVAAHSHLVEPVLGKFYDFVAGLELHPPTTAFLSNASGTWASPEEVTDPQYWVRQLRQTVRFGDCLAELLAGEERGLLEVGPGRTLTTLAQHQAGARAARPILATLPHPLDRAADLESLLTTLGKLWAAGARIDWQRVHAPARPRRVPLPTYPFARRRHWVEPPAGRRGSRRRAAAKTADLGEWFYLPSWRRALAPLPPHPATAAAAAAVAAHEVEARRGEGPPPPDLLLADGHGLAARLAARIARDGSRTILVRAGRGFSRSTDGSYEIDAGSCESYQALFADLDGRGERPARVFHLFSLSGGAPAAEGAEGFACQQGVGFYSVLSLALAMGARERPQPWPLLVVTDRLWQVESGDHPDPAKATLLGPCIVASQEYPHLACRCLDVGPEAAGSLAEERLVERLWTEARLPDGEPLVAWRGDLRWLPHYQPLDLGGDAPPRPLRRHGVYLLTGGFGGIGLALARRLAGELAAGLVLVSRTPLPARDAWEGLLASAPLEDPLARRLRAVLELEALGGRVLTIAADAGDPGQLRAAIDRAIAELGRLDGVVHLAGAGGESSVLPIAQLDRAACELQFAAKVHGTYALAAALAGRQLDFCLLFSSNATVLGGLGAAAYAAANLFLDAFALRATAAGATPWISADWDGWLLGRQRLGSVATSLDRWAMTTEESLEAFRRVVERFPAGQVVVSTGDLDERRRPPSRPGVADGSTGETARPRQRGTPAVAPADELEQQVARLWCELLGVDDLSVDENFFDLGGNSLIGLKLVQRLQRELGREVAIVRLFAAPTVRSLAASLRLPEGAAREQGDETYAGSRERGAQRRERSREMSHPSSPSPAQLAALPPTRGGQP